MNPNVQPQGHLIRSALYNIYINNIIIYVIERRADKMPLWYNLMEGVLKYHIYMLFYICVMKLYHCYMSDL